MVSLDAIEGDVPPDYSTDTVITAAIDLGLPIRLRICLDIGSALGDTRTMFGLYTGSILLSQKTILKL